MTADVFPFFLLGAIGFACSAIAAVWTVIPSWPRRNFGYSRRLNEAPNPKGRVRIYIQMGKERVTNEQ